MTSSLPVLEIKGNFFGRTIYPQSLIVIALILAKLIRGGGGGGGNAKSSPTPTAPEDKTKKKRPGLDRIKDTVRN